MKLVGRVIHVYGSRHVLENPTRPTTRAVPSRKSRMVQGFFDSISDYPWPVLLLAQTTCPEAQAPVRRSRGSVRVSPCRSTHPSLDITDSSCLRCCMLAVRSDCKGADGMLSFVHPGERGAKPLVTQRQRSPRGRAAASNSLQAV
jgi:hypothetical protein